MDEQVGGVPGGEAQLGVVRQPQHLADQLIAMKQARSYSGADRIQPQDRRQKRRRRRQDRFMFGRRLGRPHLAAVGFNGDGGDSQASRGLCQLVDQVGWQARRAGRQPRDL